jgi:hypothetical protein
MLAASAPIELDRKFQSPTGAPDEMKLGTLMSLFHRYKSKVILLEGAGLAFAQASLPVKPNPGKLVILPNAA